MKRRVLVTGASKGIGSAIAIRLAKDGFAAAVHYGRDEEGARRTLHAIKAAGGEGSLLCFDVSSKDECSRVLQTDISEHGAFYGIVANAGITKDNAFPAMAEDEWESVINTNLNSFFYVIKPCIMPMIGLRQGGRIIVMSSVSGITGNRGQTNYAASKAGLIAAAKSLAIELGKRRITVNAIAPGLIDTQMTELEPDLIKEVLKLTPLRRMGEPQEVAALASFLMSDEAGFITRQVIEINGGLQV